jgi:ERCC4-type nuclease
MPVSNFNIYIRSFRLRGVLGLSNIKYVGWRILAAISCAGIKSVEELSRYPLEKLKKSSGIGEKAVDAIREALKAMGYEQLDVNGIP